MEEIKITIPLRPITKKNHQRIAVNKKTGARFVLPSEQYTNYEHNATLFLGRYRGMDIKEPITVKCVYYMPTWHRVDLVNLLEATLDILVNAGVINDDDSKVIRSHDGSRVLHDKENPRTEIYISPYKD